MEELFKAGKLKKGDVLEPVPEILSSEAKSHLHDFWATIVNPENAKRSVMWRREEQSLAQMLKTLEDEHFAAGVPRVHSNFRLRGHEKSLRQEADEICGTLVPPPPPPLPPPGQVRKILVAAIKTFCAAILTALGAKFGGWLGGVIAATVAGTFAVLFSVGAETGANVHSG
jgi:hypothetical protein